MVELVTCPTHCIECMELRVNMTATGSSPKPLSVKHVVTDASRIVFEWIDSTFEIIYNLKLLVIALLKPTQIIKKRKKKQDKILEE